MDGDVGPHRWALAIFAVEETLAMAIYECRVVGETVLEAIAELVLQVTLGGPLALRACQCHDIHAHCFEADHLRGEPRGLLPDVAGGACERSRLQHPAAAEHRRATPDDYRKTCPRY